MKTAIALAVLAGCAAICRLGMSAAAKGGIEKRFNRDSKINGRTDGGPEGRFERQLENLLSYNGSERGQKPLD